MRHLHRSRSNRKLAGVCGGLGEAWNLDANLLRILLVVITFFSGGGIILIYILAAIIIPKEPGYPPFSGFERGNRGYHDHDPYRYGKSAPNEASPNWQEPKKQSHDFDAMMDDLEKKTLRKEINDLKEKLAKYEKGEF